MINHCEAFQGSQAGRLAPSHRCQLCRPIEAGSIEPSGQSKYCRGPETSTQPNCRYFQMQIAFVRVAPMLKIAYVAVVPNVLGRK